MAQGPRLPGRWGVAVRQRPDLKFSSSSEHILVILLYVVAQLYILSRRAPSLELFFLIQNIVKSRVHCTRDVGILAEPQKSLWLCLIFILRTFVCACLVRFPTLALSVKDVVVMASRLKVCALRCVTVVLV